VPHRKNKAVLVVEDDSSLSELYRQTLRFSGYTAEAVGDGVSALRRIVNGHAPDAVVLDLGLPRLGGRDVRSEMMVHAHTRDIPVVVVTGGDATDLNARDYPCVLHKPVAPEALVSAVDTCLTRRDRVAEPRDPRRK
jgi:two-component system OmpR family response regulator